MKKDVKNKNDKIENETVKTLHLKIDNNAKMNNVSPLRYPGGKTRACKYIEQVLIDHFDVDDIKTIISPFFGGGSFEFYLQNKYNMFILANDKFTPLATFWKCCKKNKEILCSKLDKIDYVTKEIFSDFRDRIMTENNVIKQSVYYFVINRCSFSGATLSGGFSRESSEKRFTKSSIKRIEILNLDDFKISNCDFTKYINKCENIGDDNYYYVFRSTLLFGKKIKTIWKLWRFTRNIRS